MTVSQYPTAKDLLNHRRRRGAAGFEEAVGDAMNSVSFHRPPYTSLSSLEANDIETNTSVLSERWNQGQKLSILEILNAALEILENSESSVSSAPDGRGGTDERRKTNSGLDPSSPGRE